MPRENGHTHAGARHQQPGNVKDLAGLVAQLLLLVGLALTVVDEGTRLGQGVEGDGFDVGPEVGGRENGAVVGQRLRVVDLPDLLREGAHPRDPGA